MSYKLNRYISIGNVIMTHKGFSIVKSAGLSAGLSVGKMIICHTFGVSVKNQFDRVEIK